MMATFKTTELTLGDLRKVVEAATAAGFGDDTKAATNGYYVSISGEPKTTAMAEYPHSRACGIYPHDHGTACSKDCPTCRGRAQGYYDSPFNADQ